MASICISKCINDTAGVPVRATYRNLYKWPESDAEFVRSVSSNGGCHGYPRAGATTVVDSMSCRQLYLRSYTFSRKETVPEKTKKCLDRVKEKVAHGRKRKEGGGIVGFGRGGRGRRGRTCLVMGKVREISCAALFVFFNRLLSCTASVDVVDR